MKSKREESCDGQRGLQNVKTEVDNRAPKLDPFIYYKPRNLNYDARRVKGIDNENMKILRRMNRVIRVEKNIDCWRENVIYKSKLEDPEIENQRIAKGNKHILGMIANVVSDYQAAELIKMYKANKTKAVYLKRDTRGPAEDFGKRDQSFDVCIVRSKSLLQELKPSMRAKCFFDIEIEESKLKLGRIEFELYNDVVPRTCANFVALCEGINGVSYKGTPFHRIVAGFWLQGGDVEKYNGIGGACIYGKDFENENFNLRHAGVGILSMCNNARNRNDSKFNLTIKSLPTMDGKNVVFGRAVSGISNIYKIEEFGTKTGKPTKSVIICNCGIIQK